MSRFERLGNAPDFEWPAGDARGCLEVWYSLVGPADGRFAFWHRASLLRLQGGGGEARVWAALTDREAPERSFLYTERRPLEELRVERDPFSLSIGKLYTLRDDGVAGRLLTESGPLHWTLNYPTDTQRFTLLRSEWVTRLMVARGSTRHRSVNEAVKMSGELQVGERRYVFEEAPGHQGHTASRKLVPGWSWMQCNAFEPDASLGLEALSLGPLTTLCFRQGGRMWQLNRLWQLLGPGHNSGESAQPSWHFRGAGEGVELEAELYAEGPFQSAVYRAPDESLRYNAHASIAKLKLRYRLPGEAQWREASSQAARVEWVASAPPRPADYWPQDWEREREGSRHGLEDLS